MESSKGSYIVLLPLWSFRLENYNAILKKRYFGLIQGVSDQSGQNQTAISDRKRAENLIQKVFLLSQGHEISYATTKIVIFFHFLHS